MKSLVIMGERKKPWLLFIIALLCSAVNVPNGFCKVVAGPITNSSNGHIYYLLSPTNAAAADLEATFLGGHLATVRNLEENSWIVSTFAPLSKTNNLFIGLSDHASEGSFTWVSGETNAFRNWDSGEPNNANGNEDYTEIMIDTGKWNDVVGTSHYSVAEIPLRQTNNLPVIAIRQTTATTVEIYWPSVTNQLYEVLWSSSIDTSQWNSLGIYLYGNGAMLFRTDTIDQPNRFYRVVAVQ
jgi:hypothetical protein